MSYYNVNGTNVSTYISTNNPTSTVTGFTNFPQGEKTVLTSNFEKQKVTEYTINGVSATMASGIMPYYTDYSTAGTNTLLPAQRPLWANHINVVCIGAGGGGGGGGNASNSNDRGGGSGGSGGSGAYLCNSYNTPIAITSTTNIGITVGGAGAKGNAGNNGNSGGTGGGSSISLIDANAVNSNLYILANGGTGGGGGNGAGNNDGNGGGPGSYGYNASYDSVNSNTYSRSYLFYAKNGSVGNYGGKGFYAAHNSYPGNAVNYVIDDPTLYPKLNFDNVGKSGAGGQGGYVNASGAQSAEDGKSGFVRIYWLKANNSS